MRRMDGVAIGLVKEVDAKLGRIKVTFPWMDPPQVSHWAPIASFLSGKKRGARFMPEPEDEALIAFDRGEFDHPYVVGFLWNGEDESPDNVKTNRLVVTPGGHELRFEDKDGDRRVMVKTAHGHKLTFDDKDKSVTLESKDAHQLEVLDKDAKVTLKTKSGGKLTLENDPPKAVVEAGQNIITLSPDGITIDCKAGNLKIVANAEATIEAKGKTSVTASAAMSIKSTADMTIESTAKAEIKSTGMLSVKSDAMMEVKSTGMLSIDSTAAMTIKASGVVTLQAAMLSVTAGMTTFSGVVQASTIIATTVVSTSVVSSSYTPGAGNLV